MDKAKFPALWAAAAAEGCAAGELAKPVTVVFGSAVSLFSNEIDKSKPVYVEPEGVCGFARVIVKPGNAPFAKFLVANGYARKNLDGGGVRISIAGYGQSLARKEAHAEAMAKVFRENGIERVYVDARMD